MSEPRSSAALWTPQWSFGDRVRKIRHEMGLGQAEFADMIGVTRAALGSWESGYAAGPRDVVSLAKRISALTGVRVEWLLDLEVNPPVQVGGLGPSHSRAGRLERTRSSTEPYEPGLLPGRSRVLRLVSTDRRTGSLGWSHPKAA